MFLPRNRADHSARYTASLQLCRAAAMTELVALAVE
jgi:hypothetical protein